MEENKAERSRAIILERSGAERIERNGKEREYHIIVIKVERIGASKVYQINRRVTRRS